MVGKRPSVLIVDDEQAVCNVLHDELVERGHLCATTLDGNDVLAKLAIDDFKVVLLDISLPGLSGIGVLREIWLNHSNTATIIITAVNDVDIAALALKRGAQIILSNRLT
jgi:DNA-binding NtrC family response regulator